MLNKIYSIHNLLKLENNNELNYLLTNNSLNSLNINNLDINNISKIIITELERFKVHIEEKNKMKDIQMNPLMNFNNPFPNQLSAFNLNNMQLNSN